MNVKKNQRNALEKQRGKFFLIGLVIAMSSVLVAFEWTTYEYIPVLKEYAHAEVDETEMSPVTFVKKTRPKPKYSKAPPAPTPDPIPEPEPEPDPEPEPEPDPEIDFTDFEDTAEYVDNTEPQAPFIIVEDMPEFPGGEPARMEYMANSIKYPRMAVDGGVEGTVYIGFVVEKSGEISEVKLLRGIGGGCDQEALRVIKNMPKWEEGRQRGVPVRVSLSTQVKFTLN